MRWITFDHENQTHGGLLEGETVIDLGPRPVEAWLPNPKNALAAAKTARHIPLEAVHLRQPILRPGKILAIALNYHDHASETGRSAPKTQKWFVKQATAAHGPYDPVEMPKVSDQLDYEAELVVVIGKTARHVPAARAMEIIAGLACGCDYSVRDWQAASPTMIMGKGFDTHAPFGPWITSLDEIDEVNTLGVRCLVNGEVRQDGRAGDMVFSIADQIAHLTAAFTLEPGDILFTGTPAGVGIASDPPRLLNIGDRVRVEIDGLGALEQTIIPETGETVIG